jgi:hypothetical protein
MNALALNAGSNSLKFEVVATRRTSLLVGVQAHRRECKVMQAASPN